MKPFAKTLAAALLALTATMPHADAGVLGAAATVDPFSVTTTEQAVPLTLNGGRAVSFRTTRDNTVVTVTYNTECAVSGIIGGWMSIRITVDGIVAAPDSGYTFALCSVVDQSALIPVAASRQVVITIPKAGTHSVRVLAEGHFTQSGRLDDSSITIRD